jgi:hypothetical protein
VVWLVGALLLMWIAWGPLVPVVAALLLCVPRIRWWVQDRLHVSRRVATWTAGVVAVLVAAVVVVPDGWLPTPQAPGVWSGPSYVGRPASAHEMAAGDTAPHPHLAPGSATRAGPLGLQPEADAAWFGLERCGRLETLSTGTLVALCSGPRLRLVDPESMRPTRSRDLPQTDDYACAQDVSYLDELDRVVVATTDREVLVIPATAPEGEPDLKTTASWDLKPWIPYGDCVVGLAPDWAGRIWWASRTGLVGTIAPDTGAVAVVDLGEDVRTGIAVDEGGAYVVTEDAVQRLVAGPEGDPQVAWRTERDGPSGSAPVLLDGGTVATTDEAGDRLGVVVLARDSGQQVCRTPVFDKGKGSTRSDLAPLGAGVVVTNNHGYSSPRSTLLGFTSSPGIARVDVVDGQCEVRWTSDLVSPASGVTVSRPNGLVYAWTKRPTLTGVSAWYLTAIDATSGRGMWGVRTGTGLLAGSDGSTIALDAEGGAWLGTLAGLVRVRDRG